MKRSTVTRVMKNLMRTSMVGKKIEIRAYRPPKAGESM